MIFGEYTTNSPVFLTSNYKDLKTDHFLCSDLCLHSRIESEEIAGDNKQANQSRGGCIWLQACYNRNTCGSQLLQQQHAEHQQLWMYVATVRIICVESVQLSLCLAIISQRATFAVVAFAMNHCSVCCFKRTTSLF